MNSHIHFSSTNALHLLSPSQQQTTATTHSNRRVGAIMRIGVVITALSVAVGIALADPAAAAIKTRTNIKAQGLGSALREFAANRHLQILYTTETVANQQTPGAVGELTIDETLTRLLGGTGLVYRYIDENTITIMSLDDVGAAASPRSTGGSEAEASSPGEQSQESTPSDTASAPEGANESQPAEEVE